MNEIKKSISLSPGLDFPSHKQVGKHTYPVSVKKNTANGNCITNGKSAHSRYTHAYTGDSNKRMQEQARNALMVLHFRKKANNSAAVDTLIS